MAMDHALGRRQPIDEHGRPDHEIRLAARVGEEFPLECPNCGGDIRLIAFVTGPEPIRKILTPVWPHAGWRAARAASAFTSAPNPQPTNGHQKGCVKPWCDDEN